MKRAIFRVAFVFSMCIFTMLSGFSNRSYAQQNIKGYAISSNSEIETLKKVNNRIFSTAKGSKTYNSYLVNIDDKVNYVLANLLSLKNNGVVVGIVDNVLDEESLSILKSSKEITVVGNTESISDKVLLNKELKFNRISSNKDVNEKLGNNDLLVVNVENNTDLLGSLYYAYFYNMNLVFVDSTSELSSENLDIIKSVSEPNGIYFYDGINPIDSKLKTKIYDEVKFDKSLISNYSLDATDIFKIFKDRVYLDDNKENFFVAEGKSLVDMVSAYTLAEKENSGFAIVTDSKDLFEIEDMIEEEAFKNIVLVTSTQDDTFIKLRQILGYVTGIDFAEIDIKDFSGNTISKSLIVESKEEEKTNKASEEVKVGENEVVVDGKVVDKNKQAIAEARKAEPIKTGTTNTSSLKYKKVITMTATAYSADPAENGGYTVTRLGTPLRHGVVAVDPNIIPLGSKLYIETTDGYASYGYAVAEDTGSAIKGYKIDLFIADKVEGYKFGRRQVKVYILE